MISPDRTTTRSRSEAPERSSPRDSMEAALHRVHQHGGRAHDASRGSRGAEHDASKGSGGVERGASSTGVARSSGATTRDAGSRFGRAEARSSESRSDAAPRRARRGRPGLGSLGGTDTSPLDATRTAARRSSSGSGVQASHPQSPRASHRPSLLPRTSDQAREALIELLGLASAYRGWNTRQLATALDRCNGNIVPDSGMPKLDLVVRLADALDWPVETVINQLVGGVVGWSAGGSSQACDADPVVEARGEARLLTMDMSRDALVSSMPCDTRHGPNHAARIKAVRDALRQGDSTQALRLVEGVRLLAASNHERVDAALHEADLFESRGRWSASIATLQRSLAFDLAGNGRADSAGQPECHPDGAASRVQQEGVSALEWSSVRPRLLMRLARAYHRAGLAFEGRAVASEAIDACRNGDIATLAVRAEALLLRGLCGRDQLETQQDPPRRAAESALADLEEAMALLAWPALQSRRPDAAALHHMAAGAELELRAALGRVGGSVALATVLESLEPVIDVERFSDRARLEACGWWCVFGFGIAGRQPAGATRHQVLAVLSNKAEEIASRVDCWALRERVLRLEFERRELIASEFGESSEWLLDADDLRMIVGCIGASPRFRDLGLEILRRATIAEERSPELRRGR